MSSFAETERRRSPAPGVGISGSGKASLPDSPLIADPWRATVKPYHGTKCRGLRPQISIASLQGLFYKIKEKELLMPTDFPHGLIVFFRAMSSDNNLARSVIPRARRIEPGSYNQDDYVIFDEDHRLLGIYPREFVSAILPIENTGTGPIHADNSPNLPQH